MPVRLLRATTRPFLRGSVLFSLRHSPKASSLMFAAVFLCCTQHVLPQDASRLTPLSPMVPNHYLVAYRNALIPADVEARTALAGARIVGRHEHLGLTSVQGNGVADDATNLRALASQPNVDFVVHDRMVYAHQVVTGRVTTYHNPLARPLAPSEAAAISPTLPIVSKPIADSFYNTPQGWAVRQVGGFGKNVVGGPEHGPWDVTMGKGVRIAILDSGVDAGHPDIAPNLLLNLSEVDQTPMTGLPSACDDGTPQDQQGHGTWVASLAAGAAGPETGSVIGVAPEAGILNIKVIERMPDTSVAGANLAQRCVSGQTAGLLSWVIKGIDDAMANKADVIIMSLGSIVDLSTGDGAGLKALFDRVTYQAAQGGAVLIAAAGNDGFDLSNPRYIELPAQARSVLAVVAGTNPACAEDLAPGATCAAGPVKVPYYSNYGAALQALVAPGGSLPAGGDDATSGWIRGACSAGKPATDDGPPSDAGHSYGCFNLGHNQYVQAMGTSAAAPLAAGVAALLRAVHPGWDATTVIAAMKAAAQASPSTPFPQVSLANLLSKGN